MLTFAHLRHLSVPPTQRLHVNTATCEASGHLITLVVPAGSPSEQSCFSRLNRKNSTGSKLAFTQQEDDTADSVTHLTGNGCNLEMPPIDSGSATAAFPLRMLQDAPSVLNQ
ncbi:hypothetical protein FQA47_025334 [Oryzias melastigma]|uniref:Uncharacterized protein n=1 Tax=Oryzias melastigma TaxID=30732 RepID=A0A834FRQ6_ORYME|nr:hypothetical protein FQA47_025334 [Oryzias melastigma]